MSYLFLTLLLLATSADSRELFNHALWDSATARWATDSTVDYRNFKQDVDFWTYIDQISMADTAAFESDSEREAFWINAYNASVVKSVVDRYPVASIKRGSGIVSPWEKRKVDVGGASYTFDEIRTMLVGRFHDARIHAALFMATKSSPALAVYHSESVGAELDSAMSRLARNRHAVLFDREGNSVSLSKLFDWYGKDFISGSATSVLQFIAPYVNEDDKSFAQTVPQIIFLEYDWALDDVPMTK